LIGNSTLIFVGTPVVLIILFPPQAQGPFYFPLFRPLNQPDTELLVGLDPDSDAVSDLALDPVF
jgi:hypothetical protein